MDTPPERDPAEEHANRLLDAGREDEARAYLAAEAERRPDAPSVLLYAAGIHLDEPERARDWAHRASELAPDDLVTQLRSASVLLDVDEPGLAGEALERAHPLLDETSPLLGEFVHLGGLTFAASGLDEQAEEALRSAVEYEPADIVFHKALITFLVERSRFRECERAVAEAFTHHPGNPWLQNVREGVRELLEEELSED